MRCSLIWLPSATKRALMSTGHSLPVHLIISLADHFEPSYLPLGRQVDLAEQLRRLERWCDRYPRAVEAWRDSDGQPFRHTYFYPAEQYGKAQLDLLAEHCAAGWGEIEVQLHHGVGKPDTAESTRQAILEFVDRLLGHGCLSRWQGEGPARYAFVHGNWALANSLPDGNSCGVDAEMQILADTGCYADFTLPSAPSPAQVSKINSLYECALPLAQRAPHRKGRDLRAGRAPEVFPLIMQGPLMLDYGRRIRGLPIPCIENGELTTSHPPTLARLRLWRQAHITVLGRPDWVFIKLHCHGMDQRDEEAMLGPLFTGFLRELVQGSRKNGYQLHFVTARELVNIALAACDGREGGPGNYRDYRLQLIRPGRKP